MSRALKLKSSKYIYLLCHTGSVNLVFHIVKLIRCGSSTVLSQLLVQTCVHPFNLSDHQPSFRFINLCSETSYFRWT